MWDVLSGAARASGRGWGLLAVVMAVAIALIADGRVDAASRVYPNSHGASVIDYSVASKLLARRVDEVAIVPPGRRGLRYSSCCTDDTTESAPR